MEETAATSRQLACLAGRIVLLAAELDRREGWRSEGATSVEAWLAERCKVSAATARAWAHVGARLFDLPQLADGLCEGQVSFDQVRAVVDTATPETEHAFIAQASECSVRQLSELAKVPPRASVSTTEREHSTRAVRLRTTWACHTVTAQLPAESYAEVRARPRGDGPPGSLRRRGPAGTSAWPTRWWCWSAPAGRPKGRPASTSDQRQRADGVAPSPYVVVAHVPLATLIDEDRAWPASSSTTA